MIAAILLAQASIAAPAGPVETEVPATAWSCRLTDAVGAVREPSGLLPKLPHGRDANRSLTSEMIDGGQPRKPGATGEGGDWLRDYQLSFYDGEAMMVLNLRLRKETEGIAWLTRYDSSLGKLQQPYRYVSAGLCTADFAPPSGSPQ